MSVEQTAVEADMWKHRPLILRPFRHRNFRLFFFGQVVSLIGVWMQQVATGWLVYRLSGSPALLGIVTFTMLAPIFFTTPFAGALADRFDRRRILMGTQIAGAIHALVLAVLTLSDLISVQLLIALAFFLGLIMAMEHPSRQAFYIKTVDRAELKQAIALNSLMFNLGRMVGPAFGGIVVAILGEAACFFFNACSYVVIFLTFAMIRLAPHVPQLRGNPLEDFRQGFLYVARHAAIRAVLVQIAVGGGFGMAFLALLPAFASDVLNTGSEGYGYVMSAFGIGACVAGFVLSRLPEHRLRVTASLAAGGFGLWLLVFAFTKSVSLAALVVIPAAFCSMLMAVTTNTLVQTLTDDAFRGRALAFYVMAATGSQPWGALLLGFVADHMGVSNAIALGGFVVVVAAMLGLIAQQRSKTLPDAGG